VHPFRPIDPVVPPVPIIPPVPEQVPIDPPVPEPVPIYPPVPERVAPPVNEEQQFRLESLKNSTEKHRIYAESESYKSEPRILEILRKIPSHTEKPKYFKHNRLKDISDQQYGQFGKGLSKDTDLVNKQSPTGQLRRMPTMNKEHSSLREHDFF
jgi:hypothetical protein